MKNHNLKFKTTDLFKLLLQDRKTPSFSSGMKRNQKRPKGASRRIKKPWALARGFLFVIFNFSLLVLILR